MSKGRLAIFLPSLEGGGAERVMVNLANHFSRDSYDVDLLVGIDSGPLCVEVASGVRVLSLGSPRMVKCIPAIVKYLRAEKPDSLFSTMTHANTVCILARMLSGVESRLCIREANSTNLYTDLKSRIIMLLVRIFYKYSDALISVSELVKRDYEAALGSRLPPVSTVIYNPVLTDEIIADANTESLPEFLLDIDKPVILAVGRLTAVKDFTTLIQAIAIVRKSMDVKLVILGEGSHRSVLEDQIKDLDLSADCQMPGFVTNPVAYMAHTDVFVLSSLSEGSPNVLIQAAYTGAPIVTTGLDGLVDELLDSCSGVSTVSSANAQQMATAILQHLASGVKKYDNTDQLQRYAMSQIYPEYRDVVFGKDTR